MLFVDFSRNRTETSQHTIRRCKGVKNGTSRYPRRYRKDGAKDYARFDEFAKDKGIVVENTPPRTPEANGPSGRYEGYIAEVARVMMIDAGLPLYLWPFAVETVVYIVNRLVTGTEKKSPLQKYRELLNLPNSIPNLDFIRVWGCRAYQSINQSKFY
jgi:hypothetical protein